MSDYKVVNARKVKDFYEGSDVPGEFRRLTGDLEAQQLSASLIHVPAHSDFEQGTGHFHDELEEIYLITRGSLTMRFGDKIEEVPAGHAVRVAPKTPRSHRNEGDEPVDLWIISRKIEKKDFTFIKEFWSASDKAAQKRRSHIR